MENLIITAIIAVVVSFCIFVVLPVLAKRLCPTLLRHKGTISKKGLSWDTRWQDTQQAMDSMSPKSKVVPISTFSFPFELSELRIFPLLCLYSAVKSIQTGKGIHVPDFVCMVFPDRIKEGAHVIEGMASTAVGVLLMFEGLIGLNGFDISGGGVLTRVTKCPNKIQGAVEAEINNRLTKKPIDQQYEADLRRWRQAIDNYFTAS